MSVQVAVAFNAIRSPITREAVADLARRVLDAENVRDAELSIAFVDSAAITELNERHLGHSGATDVISFTFAPLHEGAPLVGDIYACPSVARENARAAGCTVREELARLVVHGTLHVVGYDHPDSPEERLQSAMWERQEALLASWLSPVAG